MVWDLWSMPISNLEKYAWDLKSQMNLKSLDMSFTVEFALTYAKTTYHIATLASKSRTNRSQLELPGFQVLCSQYTSLHN